MGTVAKTLVGTSRSGSELVPNRYPLWLQKFLQRCPHKHPKVMAWLERHPRWIFHFTPTACSWLNAVETFFSKLTRRRLRRGSFPSLVSLQEAINRFVEEHNREPKPFVWTADPDRIVEKGPARVSCVGVDGAAGRLSDRARPELRPRVR